MEQKLQKCIEDGHAKKFGPELFDCLRAGGACPDKVSFGRGYFCGQVLLCEKPQKAQPVKK